MSKKCKSCTCGNGALGGAEIVMAGAASLSHEEGIELVKEIKRHMRDLAQFAQDEFDLTTTKAKLYWEFEAPCEDEDEDEDQE